MAALLPHKTLEMTDDFQVLADGILCDNLAGRQQVLQSYNPDGVCVQFDDIKNLKVAELRDVLTKRQIIDVYHNQIDARGDKANTEDEVFHACEEAVQEIMDLIHRISVSGNTYHFIVTGITQEELAVRLGLASKQHVSRMENGERSCSIDLLIELSCILHVSTDYLLMGSEPSKEKVKNDLLSIISELSTIAKKI